MLGAHSQLEKDVLHYLLKGDQPVVLVLARGQMTNMPADLIAEVERGRLFLVSPFPAEVKRVSAITALKRNEFMIQHAHRIVIGHAADQGMLSAILPAAKVPVEYL